MLKIDKSKSHNFPKDERGWVRLANDLVYLALNERQTLEAQWARNIAYYYGFQHLLYNPTLKVIQIDEGRNDHYVINRIAAFMEQRVAKLTRGRPSLAVVPDKTDQQTVLAAKLSEKVLKNLWKVCDKESKLDDAVTHACLAGSSFKKVIWNSDGGEGIRDELDDDGALNFDEEGKQRMTLNFLGEIENIVRTCFEIVVPLSARKVETSPWINERTTWHVEEVKAKFPDFDIDKCIKAPDETTRFERFVNAIGAGGPYGMGGFSSQQGTQSSGSKYGVKELELAVVNEMWMKPNRIYENGLLITIVGDQLLQFDKWPYDCKKYPFVKIDERKNPYGFYGLSTVTRLIPIQQHYNDNRTQMAKNRKLMANGKWWLPLGCGLHEDALTDEEGEVVQTNGNMKEPRQLQVAPLPNYVIQDLMQDIQDIRDVSGERSVDQQPFSGLTAGVAIETMAELADIGLGPSLKNIEWASIKEAKLELLLANEFYEDERTLNVIGETMGDISVVIFKNTDLAYQTDVTVQVESGFGQSKAGTRQTLINFWDRRIIYDPEVFLKAYASGNVDILFGQKDPALAVVLQDIEMIKQGAMPPVQPFDNHVVYIRSLSEFIQTPEFRKMPPDRQMIATQVLQMHLQFMQPQQEPEQNQAAVNTPYGQQVTEGEGQES